jgi:hypothetical protein
MLFWDAGKAPEEVAPYDIDWSARLGSDTIIASNWEIVGGDSPAAGTLALGAMAFTTTRTQITLSGGNLGVTYTLKNTVTTSGGGAPLIELVQLPVRYPTYTGSLATVADALQWLGQSSDPDGKITRLLSGVSTQIQSFLGYNIAQTSYTRTFDGQGTRQLFVPDLPLVSVSSLTIDGVAIPQPTPPAIRPSRPTSCRRRWNGPRCCGPWVRCRSRATSSRCTPVTPDTTSAPRAAPRRMPRRFRSRHRSTASSPAIAASSA